MARIDRRRRALPAVLVLLVAAVFAPLAGGGFVAFDDDVYVYENPQVRGGLAAGAVRWAFTTFHAGNWHPLTWLSHQLDVALFGLQPAGHHLTSVALHAANAGLLLLLLAALTGRLAPAAAVATLFAVHPLHVESVAWIAERKDVLATFFGLLSLCAHLAWLRSRAPRHYLLALLSFAASLLAKPMLVTLPLLMLLLDFWPLGRLRVPGRGGPPATGTGRACAGLLAEKAPLLTLAAASCAVTLAAQGRGGMLYPLPFEWRFGNALGAYAHYLLDALWPAGLTAFYPHPERALPAAGAALGVFFLAGVSAVTLLLARRRPSLFVGWHWFLGMLLPVIGLVQVGNQACADRYTYLPLVGLLLAAAWGLRPPPGRRAARLVACAFVLVTLALAGAARLQVRTWRDDTALFGHMLASTSGNWIAHNGVGLVHARARRYEAAAERFREAVRIRPDFAMGWSNLGNALAGLGRPEAAAALERAIRLRPDYAPAHAALVWHLLGVGDSEGAEAARRRLERVNPLEAAALERVIAPFRKPLTPR